MKTIDLVLAISARVNERGSRKRILINPASAAEVQIDQFEHQGIPVWIGPSPGEARRAIAQTPEACERIGTLMGVDLFQSDDVPPGEIRFAD